MRKILLVLLGSVLFSTSCYALEKKSTDILLLRLKKTTNLNYIIQIDKKTNTKSELISKELKLYRVKIPKTLTIERAIMLLSKDTNIAYVEADKPMKILKTGKKK